MEEAKLKQKLNDDLKGAMKAGDAIRKECIRTILSDMNYAEIARQVKLTDPDILGVIAKQVKQHKESIEAFTTGSRPDLAAKEQAELAIIQAYLPAQVSREEVVAAAKRVIAETGAQGARDKGKVMPKLMAELKGKAEGKRINEVVTELLK